MLTLANWTQWLWPDIAIYQLIEDSANGPDAAAQIRSAVDGVTLGKAKGSKEVRADAASPALDGFNCYLPGHALPDGSTYDPRTPTDVQEFVEETAIFNNGQHDDQVDMWSSMVIWTRGRVGGMTMSVPTGTAQPPRFRGNGQRDTAYRPGLRS
jgi:phage terminase large subunit-like protein